MANQQDLVMKLSCKITQIDRTANWFEMLRGKYPMKSEFVSCYVPGVTRRKVNQQQAFQILTKFINNKILHKST